MSIFNNYQLSGVDLTNPSFKMVGGMSIDDVKIKYNWILNAQINNAIIGEDSNGLVWFSGDWIDGVWENGTWYSGNFYNGRWKNGNFYSYDLDQIEMMLGNVAINRIDIRKSRFYGGKWEGGNFHYGIFGSINNTVNLPTEITLDFIINNNIDFTLINEHYYSGATSITMPIFKDGFFYNGWINASLWENGTFYDGFINNSIWENGTFTKGYFLGDIWKNGYFLGGDFSNGKWENGILSVIDFNTKSRFGVNYKNISNSACTWYDGTFNNGELHSGLNEVSGVTYPSDDNKITIWYDGTFNEGLIYGAKINNIIFNNGTIYNAYIEHITFNNGTIYDCFCQNGTFVNGDIYGGIYMYVNFENITLGDE